MRARLNTSRIHISCGLVSQYTELLVGTLAIEDPVLPLHHPFFALLEGFGDDAPADVVRRVLPIKAVLVLGVTEFHDEEVVLAEAVRGEGREGGDEIAWGVEEWREVAVVLVRESHEDRVPERIRRDRAGIGVRGSP